GAGGRDPVLPAPLPPPLLRVPASGRPRPDDRDRFPVDGRAARLGLVHLPGLLHGRRSGRPHRRARRGARPRDRGRQRGLPAGADFYGGTFFRSLAPAFPAAFLLAAALPLLVPILGGRLAAHGTVRTWPQSERSRAAVLALCAFLAVAPLIPILAFSHQEGA